MAANQILQSHWCFMDFIDLFVLFFLFYKYINALHSDNSDTVSGLLWVIILCRHQRQERAHACTTSQTHIHTDLLKPTKYIYIYISDKIRSLTKQLQHHGLNIPWHSQGHKTKQISHKCICYCHCVCSRKKPAVSQSVSDVYALLGTVGTKIAWSK